MPYELYYWDGLQGRGEFVRLTLEEAHADYVDVERTDSSEMMKLLGSKTEPHIPFAPPFLKDGDLIVSHAANILAYLGPKLDLAPKEDALRLFAHGLQLTITDMVAEAHDTHHPISTDDYYEDQKGEAKRRSAAFIKHRIPKFLGYFERVLQQNPAGNHHAVGGRLSYVDLSLFQLVDGLVYAFPRAMSRLAKDYPALATLHDAIPRRPNIARYLKSERRLPHSTSGVFRHYPELDQDP